MSRLFACVSAVERRDQYQKANAHSDYGKLKANECPKLSIRDTLVFNHVVMPRESIQARTEGGVGSPTLPLSMSRLFLITNDSV